MIQKLVMKIKNRENAFYSFLFDFLKGIINLNIPVINIIHKPLYYIHVGAYNFLRLVAMKVYCEPLFKSFCKECGSNFSLEIGMPLVSKNLSLIIGSKVCLNGKNTFASPTVFEEPTLIIGDNTYIGYQNSFHVAKKITIGKNCMFSSNVLVQDNNGHPVPPSRRHERVSKEEVMPTYIGDNVWVGYQAYIGKGVNIGDNSIIGANAVVIHDVPANVIVAGNPAKIIKTI